jgi:cob(I)alamin adenosyltransferase
MIHIYTGDGKGKTTAAIGLAVRARGAGCRVYIGQFLKKGNYGEIKVLKKLKNITIEQFGSGDFVRKKNKASEVELAEAGMAKIRSILNKQRYSLIVMDEINVALKYRLVKLKDLIILLKHIPESVDVVLTGRSVHPKLIKMADYVSEIKELRHPFRKKVKARKGIEY